MSAQELITDNIDLWTSTIKAKSTQGRGSNKKRELYGIKKLRELILELAVRGKLVQQDPDDEPASELLKCIAAEKEQLIKEGKIKKSKPLLEISDNEKSFDLPIGWEWVQFGLIAEIERGGSPRPIKSFITDDPDGLNWIKIGDTEQGGKYITSTNEKIRREGLSKTRMVYPGDFLLTNSMSFGRPYITQIQGCIHDGWLRISPPSSLDKDYLYLLLSSPYIINAFKRTAAGAVVLNLNAEKVRDVVILIPPFKEQHRIVAKVDELMSLCDQLEQQTESSLDAHNLLVDTLLATLTDARNANELSDNWARLAEHFDTLITTDYALEQLKQTILQLAVMGKLVPQDPNDEPASELLKRIAAEKEQLIKDKKLKKQKLLPEISEEEKQFEVPEGWELVALSHLGVFSGGKTPSKNNSAYWGGRIPWVTPKDMKVEKIVVAQDKVTQLAIDDGLAMVSIDSLLFVARSGILRRSFPVALAKVDCTVNQDLKVLALFNSNLADYILVMMKGFEEYILKNLIKIGTTVESLRFEDFSKHHFLLPPLEEQHRIVAKVNELMVLCDQLKTRLNDAQTIQFHLADAVVEQALC